MSFDLDFTSLVKTTCRNCYACCVDLVVDLDEEDELLWEESGIYRKLITQTKFDLTLIRPTRILKQKDDGSCIFLTNGLCTIYEFRPKVCRDFDYLSNACKMLRERVGFDPEEFS